jgi:hypothetical protein
MLRNCWQGTGIYLQNILGTKIAFGESVLGQKYKEQRSRARNIFSRENIL